MFGQLKSLPYCNTLQFVSCHKRIHQNLALFVKEDILTLHNLRIFQNKLNLRNTMKEEKLLLCSVNIVHNPTKINFYQFL
ncbi:hypothetical protein HZS_6609 [Henneguya salminicola]|nr:hypothetical protein HZS_6609 [Henneguya salminicola]